MPPPSTAALFLASQAAADSVEERSPAPAGSAATKVGEMMDDEPDDPRVEIDRTRSEIMAGGLDETIEAGAARSTLGSGRAPGVTAGSEAERMSGEARGHRPASTTAMVSRARARIIAKRAEYFVVKSR